MGRLFSRILFASLSDTAFSASECLPKKIRIIMEPQDSFIYLLSEIAPKLDARNFTAWMELAMTSSSRRAAVASIMRLASLAGSSTLPSANLCLNLLDPL